MVEGEFVGDRLGLGGGRFVDGFIRRWLIVCHDDRCLSGFQHFAEDRSVVAVRIPGRNKHLK
jgi:hypothetical protein